MVSVSIHANVGAFSVFLSLPFPFRKRVDSADRCTVYRSITDLHIDDASDRKGQLTVIALYPKGTHTHAPTSCRNR